MQIIFTSKVDNFKLSFHAIDSHSHELYIIYMTQQLEAIHTG